VAEGTEKQRKTDEEALVGSGDENSDGTMGRTLMRLGYMAA